MFSGRVPYAKTSVNAQAKKMCFMSKRYTGQFIVNKLEPQIFWYAVMKQKRICIHAETLMTIFAKIPLFTIIIAIFLNRNRTTMRTANNGNWFIIICKILFQYRINLIVYRMNSIFGNTGYPIDQSGSLSHNRHLNLLYNSILDLILIYMMSFTYLATFMVNLAKIFIK